MRDLSKYFGIVSVIFLIVMAISPFKEYYRQWRQYQREYNKHIEDLPQRISPVEEGLKQIWVPELDVIDHCTSCHLGLNEPALADAPQPFTAHPPMYHQPERFGCTPCHQGQGVATNVEDSFGFTGDWDEPVLSAPLIESSCGTCHGEERVRHAPVLNKGKELIEKYNCAGCHEIKGVEKEFTPRLDGVGSKVSRDWLVRWLENPRGVSATTRMPNFHLSNRDAGLLADFLLSFTEFPTREKLEPLPGVLQDEIPDSLYERGETLFRQARCISCHLVQGKGGSVAPEIGTVASKASRQWIYNFLQEPRSLQPGIPMSRYAFSSGELQAVTAYIATEFIDWDAPEEADTVAHSPDPNFYEKGLKLFQEYNCGGCHALAGVTTGEELGPSLVNLRKKPMYQLEFGLKDIPHTRERYVIEKIKDPRGFLSNALMPSYQFSDQQRLAIATALLSFQQQPTPAPYRVEQANTPKPVLAGEFGQLVEKYQCLTCHQINGRGGEIAPDLSRSGSQLNHEWIKEYFRLPYTLRPILTERMPNFFMPEKDIELLSQYISLVLRDDSLETEPRLQSTAADVELGRKLYFNNYGCQACHQLGGKGGYVGPPLDNLDQRLQPGWVYQRLKNPHRYQPGILEPTFNLTDEEARALTTFLFAERGNQR